MNLIEKFLEMAIVEKNASRNTISSYRTDLVLFRKFLNNKKLENIEFNDLNQYILYLNKKNYSTETITRKIVTFRQFYKFLYNEKTISNNPTLNVELPKKGLKIPKYLTIEEINKIFNFLENNNPLLKIYTMLELMYSSGMRISELISLKVSDVTQLSNKKKYIIISGKGKKERVIPFTEKSIEVLRNYLEFHNGDSVWLFPGKVGKGLDSHITRQRFHQILKEIAIKVNIAPEKISPHVIRHSFATHLLSNGMDIKIIQELLGHSSVTTTQIYTHIPDQALRESILRNHPLNKVR